MRTPRATTVQRKKRPQPTVEPAPAVDLEEDSIDATIEQLRADETNLIRKDREYAAIKAHETELESENKMLKEEVKSLKAKLVSKPTSSPEPPRISSPASNYEAVEEKERLRSVVVFGIRESNEPSATARISHDLPCVKTIFNFLNVECMPVTIYRLGKPGQHLPRLLKIVMPSRYFQRVLLKRAPQLRFFPEKGIYIRPSLTKEEREQLRLTRNRTTASHPANQSTIMSANLSSPSAQNVSPSSSFSEMMNANARQGNI
ncbi:hypothetical protein ANCCEY_08022 [Ancylostoma ceylanicum]|uniref:Uncharacterized protein n=1 Tax=Ancylostoma ceylanicum TaxID=53326 RepID=A0A0D6LS94_9BILA|nr:hypothetical protein ANCCEY_08022 [Ancylostoma ceylanicum]